MFCLFKNLLKTLAFFLLLQAGYLSASTTFIMAGETDQEIYNILSTTSDNGDLDGGFTIIATDLRNEQYRCEIKFDDGGWYSVSGIGSNNGEEENGEVANNGRFNPYNWDWENVVGANQDIGGFAQINFGHENLVGTSQYPGNVDGVKMYIRIRFGTVYEPREAGDDFDFDLSRPTMQSVNITSNNYIGVDENFDWATTGNSITVLMTAENEDLGNSSLWFATIQAQTAQIVATGDGKVWKAVILVDSHVEGPAVMSINYYDEYRNSGATFITGTTDGTSVTIDKISPFVSATILSDDNENNTSLLAMAGDDVTLTITAADIDGAPEIILKPEVKFFTTTGDDPTTMNPNVAATSFTAMITMESGDPQDAIEFFISDIKDRAGNEAIVDVTTTSDGNYVWFDSVLPSLSIVSISSNNTHDEYAKSGDVVTIDFTAAANEPLQTPTVTIDGEAATEAQDGNTYTWTATKTMDAEDNQQDVVFNIDFMDLAGNPGVDEDQSDITDGTSVKFDNTDPVIVSTVLITTNDYPEGCNPCTELATTGDAITITITTANGLYSIKDVTIAGQDVANQTTALTDKTVWEVGHELTGDEPNGFASYAYTAVDWAGNTTTVTSASSTIRIDNTIPELNTIEISSNNTTDGVANPSWANHNDADPNDIVTVSIVANETLIRPPTITIQGQIPMILKHTQALIV
jgi:hypothetical protein